MDSFISKIFEANKKCSDCPSPKAIQEFFKDLLGLLFPEFAHTRFKEKIEIAAKFSILERSLASILSRNNNLHSGDGDMIAHDFFRGLNTVYDYLHEDVDAIYVGDPAAKSRTEILRSYPGFYAIAAYRIANLLHKLGVSLIPRMITEYAHSKTGIEIHPGATIGQHFCIDHGTGVVIGETTIIGDHVKIYQGVTLGALSVNKEDADKKRHPTIEDHVIIYSGATILGGKTIIGANSVIGGNVWLTKSVPAGSKVYYQTQMYHTGREVTDMYVFKNDNNEVI
ncbi:serine acetyltransferase [Algoriphagus lutimaris]|uniref:serine O-acetyltransferase EpsC n=1 Tax=Algoriphagus lutimaris TaxID=613197 RepID=UPI00196AFA0D|nr:serine O-acetyltransferase EpsC [Algoriphagus lutimaris]MBN3521725.1 serine acetyltransferase [Algoriphagus lutimaris]